MTDTGGELIQTPLAPLEENSFARSGHFTLSPDGVLTGDVVVKSAGDHAFRERLMFANKSEQERTQAVERNLNR